MICKGFDVTGIGKGRNETDRRQRIVDATLVVIAQQGVAGTTHRRIAAAAAVPLGSVTYYFDTLDTLIRTAFLQLAEQSSAAFGERLAQATDRETAKAAVVSIIAESIWATPATLLLSYELYAYAARNPPVAVVMQRWMQNSRDALERFFDPLTARSLDALVEGIGIHNSIDTAPLNPDEIEEIVHRLTSFRQHRA